MAETIVAILLLIPLFGALLWTYFYPEESMLFGKRWMYREEPEFSDAAIHYTKFISGAVIALLVFVLLVSIVKKPIFNLFAFLGVLVYIGYGIHRLLKKL